MHTLVSWMNCCPVHIRQAGRMMPAVCIFEVLRRHYPECTVTQTPKSTGLLKYAWAGQATALLDSDSEFYAARKYKIIGNTKSHTGYFKDKVDYIRYQYQWRGHIFQVYAAEYMEGSHRIQLHYIVYPRKIGRHHPWTVANSGSTDHGSDKTPSQGRRRDLGL